MDVRIECIQLLGLYAVPAYMHTEPTSFPLWEVHSPAYINKTSMSILYFVGLL